MSVRSHDDRHPDALSVSADLLLVCSVRCAPMSDRTSVLLTSLFASCCFVVRRSAFLFYCSERRPVLKGANPNWGMSDLSKALGEEWRQMGNNTKAPYELKAQADKDRYQREMAQFKGKR